MSGTVATSKPAGPCGRCISSREIGLRLIAMMLLDIFCLLVGLLHKSLYIYKPLTNLILNYCSCTALIARPSCSTICGTTALPSDLSLSTLRDTPLATRPTLGSNSHVSIPLEYFPLLRDDCLTSPASSHLEVQHGVRWLSG